MFPWDGSRLPIVPTHLLKIKIYPKIDHTTIKYGEGVATILSYGSKNTLPCIVDEIKPLLGLKKIGTNFVYCRNTYKIYLKPSVKEGWVIPDSFLNKSKITKGKLSEEISDVFAFREIVGIRGGESDIVLREGHPVSLYDRVYLDGRNLIGTRTIDTWFQSGPEAAIKRLMTNFSPDFNERKSQTLLGFQWKIEEIINRIDKEYIWFASTIIDRIRQRL